MNVSAAKAHWARYAIAAVVLGLAVFGISQCVLADESLSAPPTPRDLPVATESGGSNLAPPNRRMADPLGSPDSGMARLSITTLADDGRILPSVEILGRRLDSGRNEQDASFGSTDRSGELRLQIDPGKYRIVAMGGSVDEGDANGTSHAMDVVECQVVDGASLVLRLAPLSASVEIRCVDDAGNPVVDADVECTYHGTRVKTSDEMGVVVFASLPAGREVQIGACELNSDSRREPLLLPRPQKKAMTLEDGERRIVEFRYCRLGRIILGVENDPWRRWSSSDGVSVTLFPEAGGSRGVVLGPKTMNQECVVPPGAIEIFAQVPANLGVQFKRLQISLSPGELRHVNLQPLEGEFEVRGMVMDPNGIGVAGIEVIANYPVDLALSRTLARTDSSGNFLFRGLLGGLIILDVELASLPDQSRSWAFYGDGTSESRQIAVPVSNPVEMRLSQGFELRGRVSKRGRPVLRGRINIDQSRYRGLSDYCDISRDPGAFSFPHLRAGAYSIWLDGEAPLTVQLSHATSPSGVLTVDLVY